MLKKMVLTVMLSGLSAHVLAANSYVVMNTSMGPIEIELFNDKAPISTKNFEQYVKSNFYTGTIFHRVIPGFMIQGGGMDEKLIEKPNRQPITNESSNGVPNTRGTLAMARTNDPNSAASQFFINLVDNRYLDKSAGNAGYAVFGKVIKGMDIVDEISQVPTSTYGMHQNVPTKPVQILSINIKGAK